MKGEVLTLDKDDCHRDSMDLSSFAIEVDAILGMICLSHIRGF